VRVVAPVTAQRIMRRSLRNAPSARRAGKRNNNLAAYHNKIRWRSAGLKRTGYQPEAWLVQRARGAWAHLMRVSKLRMPDQIEAAIA